MGGSSTQDDPCRSNIGGRDPCNLCGVDACGIITTDAARSVYMYVCLSVGHSNNCEFGLNRSRIPLGIWWTRVKEPCIRLGPDLPVSRDNFLVHPSAYLGLVLIPCLYICVVSVSVCLHYTVLCELRLIGDESVPIQLAQCWFPGLAIFNGQI